ncbi:exodeoxyribonuclease III [Candidatus Woesearchaeota archaeon]|nr:exodeoxyribonuclease III [Candidatus Woesearchaeota archaeon]
MKILSWNVNGLRAAERKGFSKKFKRYSPDIMCIQETRAKIKQLPKRLQEPEDYHAYFNIAKKKGYSGVTVYTKEKPKKVETKLGMRRFDREGRLLKLTFPEFILINFYIPFGGHLKQNLPYKLKVYKRLLTYVRKLKNKKVILTGDFNIAHTELDLARPKQNKDSIMFTPEERKQIDKLVKIGYIDTFRHKHPKKKKYTFWSQRTRARKRNIGWRIDYFFVTKKLLKSVKKSYIKSRVMGSDHCPVGLTLK